MSTPLTLKVSEEGPYQPNRTPSGHQSEVILYCKIQSAKLASQLLAGECLAELENSEPRRDSQSVSDSRLAICCGQWPSWIPITGNGCAS